MLREERSATLLAALVTLVVTLFLLVPIMETISSGFYSDGTISFYWFSRVISNPILMAELERFTQPRKGSAPQLTADSRISRHRPPVRIARQVATE